MLCMLCSLLIVMKDVSPASLPPEAASLPAATAKRRICNVLSGCINIRPLPAGPGGKPRTFCQLMVHIDPHIPMVPAFLMNFVLGVLAPYIFSQIKQVGSLRALCWGAGAIPLMSVKASMWVGRCRLLRCWWVHLFRGLILGGGRVASVLAASASRPAGTAYDNSNELAHSMRFKIQILCEHPHD